MTTYPESHKYGATLTSDRVPNTVKTSSRQGGNRMTEVTEVAKQCATQALGELAGQFRVEARPCHFVTTPLAEANVCVAVRPARPCADLDAAEQSLASLSGLVYLVRQRSEIWAYVAAGVTA